MPHPRLLVEVGCTRLPRSAARMPSFPRRASVAEVAPWSAASWSSSGGVVTVGIVVLFSAIDVEATAKIVTGPLLLIGLGLGGLASRKLGSVTVSAVPDSQSPEVGGLQNTASQFGASLGTAWRARR